MGSNKTRLLSFGQYLTTLASRVIRRLRGSDRCGYRREQSLSDESLTFCNHCLNSSHVIA